MIKSSKHVSWFAPIVIMGTLIGACGGGPGDAEFVAACLKEGQGGASRMLDQEIGVSRDAFCECGAKVAGSSLSADGYRAMVLDMQGNGEEARAITSKMSESQQMAMLQGTAAMFEQCAAGEK